MSIALPYIVLNFVLLHITHEVFNSRKNGSDERLWRYVVTTAIWREQNGQTYRIHPLKWLEPLQEPGSGQSSEERQGRRNRTISTRDRVRACVGGRGDSFRAPVTAVGVAHAGRQLHVSLQPFWLRTVIRRGDHITVSFHGNCFKQRAKSI